MINEIETVTKEDYNMSNLKWFTGDIEVVEIEGRFIALDGWNGEEYLFNDQKIKMTCFNMPL